MRIVFLNIMGALGGAERVLLDMIASLRETEPALDLHLVLGSDGPLGDQARKLGATVTVLPVPRAIEQLGDWALGEGGRIRALARLGFTAVPSVWAAFRYSRRLRQTLAHIGPDLVHSNSIKFHLLTRLAGLSAVTVVWHIHDFLGARRLMARVLRWASGQVGGAVAISRAVAEDAAGVIPRVPVRTIYNAIDTREFSPGSDDCRRLDGLAGVESGSQLRIGLVATYALWKGQETFLEAAAHVLRDVRMPLRFYIVGGPVYRTQGSQWTREQLESKAQKLGVGASIAFVPFQEDVSAVYRALDIVVHASSQPEPFGRTIVEAMACGKPVVVSAAGGARELFTDGQDALGFTPRDSAGLAAVLRRLIDNRELRQRLGQAARQTAVTRFSRSRIGPELLNFYREISSDRVGKKSNSSSR